MILEVQIKVPGGSDRTLQFPNSPVRIGRNQLNDISIEDPFVSEWHGTIRFDGASIAYFDLGSTNGTLLDGKRLAKNVAAELSPDSRLQLGLMELIVSRRPEHAPPARPINANRGGTMEWNRADVGFQMGPPAPVARTQPVAALTPPRDDSSGAVRPPLDTGSRPPSQAGNAQPSGTTDRGELVARQRKLLEAFAEAFIGLRKGYEQFGAEVGVRTINGTGTLHRARNRTELLEYLLQPDADLAAITKDLVAIFADFGIHHIAMMQGVTEGARATLRGLSPAANGIDAGGRLFGGGKAKNQWKAYLERFEQMFTDDNELHAALFGSHFARAYASVTLGNGGKSPGNSQHGDADDDDGEGNQNSENRWQR